MKPMFMGKFRNLDDVRQLFGAEQIDRINYDNLFLAFWMKSDDKDDSSELSQILYSCNGSLYLLSANIDIETGAIKDIDTLPTVVPDLKEAIEIVEQEGQDNKFYSSLDQLKTLIAFLEEKFMISNKI